MRGRGGGRGKRMRGGRKRIEGVEGKRMRGERIRQYRERKKRGEEAAGNGKEVDRGWGGEEIEGGEGEDGGRGWWGEAEGRG
jgi:hypothetical protein